MADEDMRAVPLALLDRAREHVPFMGETWKALTAAMNGAQQSGETEAQREEVCAAWADLPDSLRCHPGLKRLYLALGGLRDRKDADGVSASEKQNRRRSATGKP